MDTTAIGSSRPAPTHVGRRSRRRLSAPLAVLLAVALAVIAPQACAACSCIVMTFGEAAEQAEVVFVGTVTGREAGARSESGPAIDYAFEVSDVYSGSVGSQVVVSTPDNSAACGFNFESGQTYVVMAVTSGSGLMTNLCTGTALASEVETSDLESLGEPTAPGPVATAAPMSEGAADEGQSGSSALWLGLGGLGLVALAMVLLIWRPRRRAA
jgi:hypothetical protein